MAATPRLLILGGTGWLGPRITRAALDAGLEVTTLNRGRAEDAVPEGATVVVGDRTAADGYDQVSDQAWDFVLDTTWQPGQGRSALAALADQAGWWGFVSSTGCYTDSFSVPDESAPTVEPFDEDQADADHYLGAKIAIERAARAAVGDRLLVARSGLLSGPGDVSDRFGYWVGRCDLAGSGPVLVPDAPSQLVQTIDVGDLARWLVASMLAHRVGTLNAVGPTYTFREVVTAAHAATGARAELVDADPDWLRAHRVTPWLGPRSLPLWVPDGYDTGGPIIADDAAFRATKPRYTALSTLTVTSLADERRRGTDRDRKAGLSRSDELGLVRELRA